MKTVKKVLWFIFKPTAFKIGLVMTGAVVYIAFMFYTTPAYQREQHTVLRLLTMLHQKSIDIRMVNRGERDGTDEVALITVDENSLETIGRWPWPRSRIAQMIEQLVGYGAKVIAFDAVFSEPEVNPAMRTLANLKNSGLTTPQINALIDKELEAQNSDMIFAKTVAQTSDHLVMGAYFDFANVSYHPFQEYCGALIEAKTPEHKFLENEAMPVAALEENSVEAPAELMTPLQAKLDEIENTLTEKVDAKSLTAHQKIELRNKVEHELESYCARWLVDPSATPTSEVENRAPASAANPLDFMNSVLHNNVLRTGRWWMNVAPVAQGTKHTGFFNAFLDSDGVIRNSNLVVRYGNQYLPSLSLKAIMVAKNLGAIVNIASDPKDPSSKSIRDIVLTNMETGEPVETLPVDGEGRIAINYSGKQHSFAHLGVGELFNGKDTAQIQIRKNGKDETREVKKAEFIKDKIFLFGATATGIYDLRVTPFSENFPGPEIHTNIMDNLLRKDYLRAPASEDVYMVSSLAAGGVVLSGIVASMGAVLGLMVTAMALALIYYFDKIYFFNNGMVITIVLPMFMIGTLYIVLTFYKYLTEERKKKELKGTFQKFVSPAIVDELLKNPENLQLGGRKQHMTVMFSDVRGFTTMSEKLEPTKLSDLLNRYLTPMTRLVFETRGTLDKYMGDAIMAFWGAPISFVDHAKQACVCALKMMHQLDLTRKEFQAEGLPDIDIGIGINTGDMSVGNMGSDIVRSYTVMGDAVNLGSRLEGINKEYGTHVIISEFTYKEVKDDFTCREVDWVRVKGKKEPVRIFELLGDKTVDEKIQKKIEFFNKGFEAYHQKNWDEALQAFTAALEVDPNDYPSKVYVKRCANYKVEPPPAEWDGVYEMKTK